MRALLIQPEFSPFGFWNYRDVCRIAGAKYPAAPLGLITVAALLPSEWAIRLVDMNTTRLTDSDLEWSDLVFVSGMLPQQHAIVELITRAHSKGRRVVAGGPDPTSQPSVYRDADYLVLGEGECSVPLFLKDLRSGATHGLYEPDGARADITQSPVPRFDLLKFDDYLMIGVQLTRGCPFDCEFCDIIELFGRTPRSKYPAQIIAELDELYRLGYRGQVDFVDDNFIGNRKRVKETLREVRAWSIAHHHPFFYSTESTINLADDRELIGLMRDTDFRYVFVGIESTSDEVLLATHKRQNVNRKLERDLAVIYRHGMIVNAGFIIGFDNETRESARRIADQVERGRICMAMVGLLRALPNTQLTRRLIREHRFFEDSNRLGPADAGGVDQTTADLNFETVRSRYDVIKDYLYVVGRIYGVRSYFNRCLGLALVLKLRPKYRPPISKLTRTVQGFTRLVGRLGLIPPVSFYFWRNVLVTLVLNPSSLESVVNLMAMYVHFGRQSRYIERTLRTMIARP